MKDLIPVLVSNIYGFDGIIFVVAVINFFVYLMTIGRARRLYDVLHPTAKAKNSLNEAKVVAMRKQTSSIYSVFINLTAIFPLLGILGTVISLLNMAENITNAQANFFGALTSTFWGLIFAIFYKLLDARPAALIEDNEKNVAFYLDRATKKSIANKEKVCIEEEK